MLVAGGVAQGLGRREAGLDAGSSQAAPGNRLRKPVELLGAIGRVNHTGSVLKLRGQIAQRKPCFPQWAGTWGTGGLWAKKQRLHEAKHKFKEGRSVAFG